MKQNISHNLSNQARTKSIQIYRYLQALNQLRNPAKREIQDQAWMMWFHDVPQHPCIRRGAIANSSTDVSEQNGNQLLEGQKVDTEASEDFILKVRRPLLVDPPEPPLELLPWLQHGWQRIDGQVSIKPALSSENSQVQTIRFEDNPQRKFLL